MKLWTLPLPDTRAAAQWVRGFMVPGRVHCPGGPSSDGFDGLSALVKWVEQGEASERVIARGAGALRATTHRPLCP